MKLLRAVCALIALSRSIECAGQISASSLAEALHHIALDPDETYRVRDLRLRRGDVSFYLNEGVLSFATPVNGRRIAAVFTVAGVDAGDAEVIVLPPQPAERASLSSFTKSPNLNEHFTSSVLFFSDNTAEELLAQIKDAPLRKAPELAGKLSPSANPVLQGASAQVTTQIVASLLDAHTLADGFFYSTVTGGELGTFDVLFDPKSFEPVTVGSFAAGQTGSSVHFNLWTGYRPKHAPLHVRPIAVSGDYRLDTTIQPDLGISVSATFNLSAPPDCGRVLSLSLSKRMNVKSAAIDGLPAEVYQNFAADVNAFDAEGQFLLVSQTPFIPGRGYLIKIQYSGNVIRQVSQASYFVSERNLWYPHTDPMLTTFDLTFRCPEHFDVVSTGELIDEKVLNGERTVHRKTSTPQQLAGFNVGEYKLLTSDSGPYRLQSYAEKSAADDMNGIPQQGVRVLSFYTHQWLPLPIHTLAITPIPGNFGQGFPGLIYLGRFAYVPAKQRPPELRNAQSNTFFSQILLPHEIAHQWWGNMVTSADYRTDWLMEAMSDLSALDFTKQSEGQAAVDGILRHYRDELGGSVDGRGVESSGPVDFGLRLLSTSGLIVWHTVVYEKGAWILHMLRQRLGEQGFRNLQLAILHDFADKPISNEEFRQAASKFVPPGQPDRALTTFFDTWIYGTGIPRIRMSHSGSTIEVSGVDNTFAADLPLRCKSNNNSEKVRWLRIVSGTNSAPASSCRLPLPMDYLYFPQ